MNLKRKQWVDSVWATLADSSEKNNIKLYQKEWSKYVKRSKPLVSIIGPYDSGKSSMLKRILVDDFVSVPEWLTISGRRETFILNDVDALECTLRDTPGLAAGNRKHDKLAIESLALTDACVLVVPPQLLTDKKDDILAAIMGKASGHYTIREYWGAGLIVVIARMDEAGIDPEEDNEGYSQLCKKKGNEIKDLFSGAGLDLNKLDVHTISADAYQSVGNMKEVEPFLYDGSRKWDGMADLARTLSNLTEFASILREKAEVRFTIRIASNVRENLSNCLEKTRHDKERCINEKARISNVEIELNNIKESGRADLLREVEEEITALSRRNDINDPKEMNTLIANRIKDLYYEWWKKTVTNVDKLLVNFHKDYSLRQEIPFFQDFKLVPEDTAAEEKDNSNRDKLSEGIKKIGPGVQIAGRTWFETQLNMSMSEMEEELKKVREFKTLRNYLKGVANKPKIPNKETLEKVERAVKFQTITNLISTLGLTVMELGSLVMDIYGDKKEANKRKARRQELRNKIREKAERYVDDILKSLWKDLDEVESWLINEAKKFQNMHQGLEKEEELFLGVVNRLESLLSDVPFSD